MTLTKESTNKDILDYLIAPATNIRDLGSISFMAWVATKLNGVQTYKAATQELLMMVRNPVIGKLPDDEKVNVVKKLLELGVEV